MWMVTVFFSFLIHANTFEATEGTYRFRLVVKKDLITYESPRVSKKIAVSECNRVQARILNEHLFASTSSKQSSSKILIDGKPYWLQANPVSFSSDLDQRIIALDIQKNSSCK